MIVQFGKAKKINQSNIGLLVCFTRSELYGIKNARKDIYLHLICKASYVEVSSFYEKLRKVPDNYVSGLKPEYLLMDVNFGARSSDYDYRFSNFGSWLNTYRCSSTTFIDKLIEPFLVDVRNENNFDDDSFFSKSDMNKFIFLFRGINWSMLQMVFKRNNIAISPGNAGNRLFVNTLEMFFYKFLNHIKFDAPNIYNLQKASKSFDSLNFALNYEEYEDLDADRGFMLNAALNLLEIELKSFKEKRIVLMFKITSEESDIIKFKSRLSNINPHAERVLKKTNNRIVSLNESLKDIRSELCELESLITKLENYLVKLKNPESLSYQFLSEIYKDRYRDLHIKEIVTEINSQNAYRSYIKDKKKSPFSTMSSNRSYSTLSISKKKIIQKLI